jgi:hypothetical protein
METQELHRELHRGRLIDHIQLGLSEMQIGFGT